MPSIFESIIRAEDFLHRQFESVNLVLRTSDAGTQRLERAAAEPALIVVRLPPQNITEQAVSGGSTPDFPYKGALAGPSRLTCRLPDALTHIDYRLDALLEQLRSAQLVLVDHVAAGEQATVIEFPDRLLLVPQASPKEQRIVIREYEFFDRNETPQGQGGGSGSQPMDRAAALSMRMYFR